MNPYSTGHSAYAQSAAPVRTDRAVEYEAFARATAGLKNAKSEEAFSAIASALVDNSRLWRLMASSVADNHNQLPQQLRVQIFNLAAFTLQHTSKVLNGSATPDILIEINTMIMRGLRAQETAK